MILLKQGKQYFEEVVKPQLSDFMGRVFEDMCRNFVMCMGGGNSLPFPVMRTGRWWGNNPTLHREEEIDLVAVNPPQKKMLIGECKYQKKKISLETARLLMERGNLIARDFQKVYALFPGAVLRVMWRNWLNVSGFCCLRWRICIDNVIWDLLAF